MKTKEYLFEGLENLNDGFDAESIIYVSEQDFETVLNRAEAKNIAIFRLDVCHDLRQFHHRVNHGSTR
ncbi:hypothetical protein ACM67B_06985 [Neisseria sp. CCUG17229]|uniref:hypothetical protein n=1 Tax=Neisseria sp. CCUG17229 TaxID=3392036 RepID=UPI003A1029CA